MAMAISSTVWCLCVLVCLHLVAARLYKDGKQLFIDTSTLETDMELVRNLADDCRVEELYVTYVPDVSLTQQDIDRLQKCPLKDLGLTKSTCFPPAARIDLSVLTMLKKLDLNGCRNKDFVLTGLPESLDELSIFGLREQNFDMKNTDPRLLSSLTYMWVTQTVLCCPGVVYGADLPHVEKCSHSYSIIHCGFSEDGKALGVVRQEHIADLEKTTTGHCNLTQLVIDLPDFELTGEDIKGLGQCPLTRLILYDSRCFPSINVDLSGLTHLSDLEIFICRNRHFVITGLPTSLERLIIPGLTEHNLHIHAGDSEEEVGTSLEHVIVYNPAMCCRDSQLRMFSRDLSGVCRDVDGHRCGLTDGSPYGVNAVYLSVASRRQLETTIGRKQLGHDCKVKSFYTTGEQFAIGQDDIDKLSRCPLQHIVIPYTSCFRGAIDLSGLSQLATLSIPYCTRLDFTITGLPASLQNLDIRGLDTRNIQLVQYNSSFGSSLHRLEVSNPRTCQCWPQVAKRMFNKPLMAQRDTCGLTDTVYSAVKLEYITSYNLINHEVGFQSDGFDSAISSCEFLIQDSVLRVLLWLMAVFATLGNSTVLVYRLGWDRKSLQKSHGIYPINLAVSDLLMGVYLFIIADADARSRGEYVFFDEDWRQGPLCHLAGFFSTLSSETSAVFILLITVDRFLAIQFPFGQYWISLKHTWVLCGATWLAGVILASLPLVVPDWEVYSKNSICVGLPLNKDTYPGSQYATALFIGINSVLFFLIAIGQTGIYRANWANSKKVTLSEGQAKGRYKKDMAIAKQLSVIVVTEFLCWFPICVMGVMAQTGQLIPDAAYAWSAVVVLPINSAINPMLYTLRHVLAEVVSKCVARCRHGNWIPGRNVAVGYRPVQLNRDGKSGGDAGNNSETSHERPAAKLSDETKM